MTIVPTAPAPAPLIEGRDALVLDCDVDSNPAPSISWYKDVQTDVSGVPRLQEIERGPQLRLDTVNRHDAGVYTCIATNIIGESDRVDLPIDVHCKYLLDQVLYISCKYSLLSLLPCACCHQTHRNYNNKVYCLLVFLSPISLITVPS